MKSHTISNFAVLILMPVCLIYAAENWPMFNHDPQLSGRTGEYISGNVSLKWERQFAQSAHVRAQPVIVDGVIYQGWMDGMIRAMDIEDGADLWTVDTKGTILGSACVTGDRVIFSLFLGDRGELQAYDRSGELQWTVQTPEPFFASPIAYRGIIYIGSLGSKLYAVDVEDGIVVWAKDLGGQVWGAAAAKNGIVVVEANDMKGYAFNTEGTLVWTVDLPGESMRHVHPMIGLNTVLFTTAPRASNYKALEDIPFYGEEPFETIWDGRGPIFTDAQGLVSSNETFFNDYPFALANFAVNLSDGQKAFDVFLGSPYWGTLTPLMLTDRLALEKAHQASFSIDMETGEITYLGDSQTLFRRDEYAYCSVGGGQRVYGAIADDLGEMNYDTDQKRGLVGDFYSHGVHEWTHPPDAVNAYLTAPGPGDGNSGYATTPVPYDGNIVWQYCGSWLRVDEGGAAHETPDAQAPATPAGLAAAQVAGSTVTLTWTAATDNVAVIGYRIYRDDTLIAETDNTGYTDVNLAGSTEYSYTVSAYDVHNNESTKSEPVTATTLKTIHAFKGIQAEIIWKELSDRIMVSVPLTGHHRLEVIRPDGTLMEIRKKKGTGTYIFYKGNLNKGIYIFRILTGNRGYCKTFVLL
jgi:hypothetical protein